MDRSHLSRPEAILAGRLHAGHILHQEAVGVVPGQEDVLDHGQHPLLPEAQALRPHDWGVDEIQPQRVRAVLLQDQARILYAWRLFGTRAKALQDQADVVRVCPKLFWFFYLGQVHKQSLQLMRL